MGRTQTDGAMQTGVEEESKGDETNGKRDKYVGGGSGEDLVVRIELFRGDGDNGADIKTNWQETHAHTYYAHSIKKSGNNHKK